MYRSTLKIEEINLQELLDISKEAGEAIMKIYHQPFDVIKKSDGSPLTKADNASNDIIINYLASKYSIPILSEENEAIPYSVRKDWTQYWCIDPLDGTKEFINKRREFTVNIALIENNIPILGIIYAPVFKDLFYAIKGQGCFFEYNNVKTKLNSNSKLIFENKHFDSKDHNLIKLILSYSHNTGFNLNDFFSYENRNPIQLLSMGSSLKFCRIAQETVDMNIRIHPTMEWDTAAAQIILEESGRKLNQLENNQPLIYNKENLTNPSFVAY